MTELYDENQPYRQTSNVSRTLVGDKLVDHFDAVGAPPVSTKYLVSIDWTKTTARRDETF